MKKKNNWFVSCFIWYITILMIVFFAVMAYGLIGR